MSHRFARALVPACCVAASVWGQSSFAATYVGVGNAQWNVASNWANPANVPDTTGETAVINDGDTAIISANYTIGGLTLSGFGSRVFGAGTVTTNTLSFADGGIEGGAAVVVNGQASMPVHSTLSLRNGSLTLKGATALSTGITNGAAVYLSYGGALTNAGTVTLSTDFTVSTIGDDGTFLNSGTLNKTGGTGASTFASFVNTGTLASQGGVIELRMLDNAASNGTFSVTAGGTLRLTNSNYVGTHSLGGAKFSGAGTIDLDSTTFTTGAAGVTSTATDLRLTGATVIGNYTLTDLNWSGGQFGNATTASNVTISHGATFATTGQYSFLLMQKTAMTLSGNTLVSGSGYNVHLRDGSRITNTGTLSLSGSVGLEAESNGVDGVVNTGTVLKTGGGQSNIFGLTTTGVLQAQSGTLYALMATGDASGTFAATAGATLRLSTFANSLTLAANSTLVGQGTFQFDKRTIINGNVQAAGLTLNTPLSSSQVPVTVEIPGTLYSIVGPLAGAGFTKTGAGTLRLSGANTYSGATNVAAGALDTTPPAYTQILTNAGGLNFTGKLAQWSLLYGVDSNPTGRVRAMLTAGYAGRFTTGQIRSTVTNADLSIGYYDDGRTLHVAPALPGDANLDGSVNFSDFLLLQAAYLQPSGWQGGDFNYSGVTDFSDFLLLQAHYGQSLDGTAVVTSTAESAAIRAFFSNPGVPEPALATPLLVAVVFLRRRTRTRS